MMKQPTFAAWRLVVAAGLALAVLGACSTEKTVYPESLNRSRSGGENAYTDTSQTIFGEGGLLSFGGQRESDSGGGDGIGVNSFLWRASLDTISFMPLASADPFGGVIITDWFSPEIVADERFKINLYILGRDLRADGVRAAVFRQQRDSSGGWIDAAVDSQTAIDLENAILTRARQLRIATVQ